MSCFWINVWTGENDSISAEMFCFPLNLKSVYFGSAVRVRGQPSIRLTTWISRLEMFSFKNIFWDVSNLRITSQDPKVFRKTLFIEFENKPWS